MPNSKQEGIEQWRAETAKRVSGTWHTAINQESGVKVHCLIDGEGFLVDLEYEFPKGGTLGYDHIEGYPHNLAPIERDLGFPLKIRQ